MQKFKYFWAFIVVVCIQTSPVLGDRLKDLTSLAGVRSNQLVGYGVVVGGLGVTGADNSSLTVNIPTVGRIPRGASVERIVPTEFLNTDFVILNLHRGDFSTAYNVSETINNNFGAEIGRASCRERV